MEKRDEFSGRLLYSYREGGGGRERDRERETAERREKRWENRCDGLKI